MFFLYCFVFLRSGKDDPQAFLNRITAATDMTTRLDSADVEVKTDLTVGQHPVVDIQECKCGMPLCICEAPAAAPTLDPVPLRV